MTENEKATPTLEGEKANGSISNPTTKPTSVVSPTPSKPPTSLNLAAKVNSAQGSGMKIPSGLKGFNTNDETDDYFHGLIYAETSARKTTEAARMFGPENTLIVLCRQPEQLIPLRGLGYRVLHAETVEALEFALEFPEIAAEKVLNWSEWKNLKDRALVLDDATEAVDLLLDKNKTKDDGTPYKDMRKVYGLAGEDLKELFLSLRRKKVHLPWIALAKVSTNPITMEERVAPSLPPSMVGWLNTDLEFVFYIDKSKWKFITDSIYTSYVGEDEKGKTKTYRREVFAKNKVPLKHVGKKVFPATAEAVMDLRKIFDAARNGTPSEVWNKKEEVK